MRKVINISVPEEIYKQVEKEKKEGGFASKSEYIRHVLRKYKEDRIVEDINESIRAKVEKRKGPTRTKPCRGIFSVGDY